MTTLQLLRERWAENESDAANLLGEGCPQRVWEVSGASATDCTAALTVAAEGGRAQIVKPLHGFGSGVFEIALPYRRDAYRVVYALQIGDAIWVVHAFQKKSTQGIKTPKHEIDLIEERLKKLKEALG